MVKKAVTTEYEDQFDAEDAPSIKASLTLDKAGKGQVFIRKTATGAGTILSLEQFERVAKFIEECKLEEYASG